VAVVTRTAIEEVEASSHTIPADEPESDGTFAWDSTTIVVVQAHGGGRTGIGYTYTHESAAELIEDELQAAVRGCDAMGVRAAWHEMSAALRNIGRPGLGFMALSAVDLALWDLKARLLDQALVTVLDAAHECVPIYGSGGFCSYSDDRLRKQFGGWAAEGISRVKMKVGRDPARDRERVRAAREAVGADVELYVDANGAYTREQALESAQLYAQEFGVKWFEEPVSSDDLEGLRFVREHSPAGLEVAAGEYGDLLPYFARMAPCVDCLQADVTRCGGITGLLAIAGVAHAHELDLSAHCAPAISAHAFCAVQRLRHLEYFHDHVRVEHELFDGVLEPEDGMLKPDRSRPGNGLSLR
jgi:L-alanine-DL-glutamate epimerase-like enolase superfamily enzyme